MASAMKRCWEWSQGVMSMLMVQVFFTGSQLLSRVLMSRGTFILAVMTYRQVVAALCVSPFAFFFERGAWKKLSWLVWFWLFVNALAWLTATTLLYYGIGDTTATYASNFGNLVPIVTFVLSIVARTEKLGLGTWAGKFKTLGAILCLAGALSTGLYKGKAFHIGHHGLHPSITVKMSEAHWTRGTCILIGSCLSYATWYIVQVKLLKVFPSKYYATTLMCIITSMQSTVMGLSLNRHKAAWRLGWDLQLVTIIYSGALSTAATFCLTSWVIAQRGPTYPSMFNPVTLIFVAISEALIFGQEIRIGMLLGMVLILVGLYSFLLGKRKEMKCLPQPNAGVGEAAMTAVPESAAVLQSKATVMTTTSPADNTIDVEQGSDKDGVKP